jgi:hypothetical protein
MNYEELIENGELSDKGLDYVIELSNEGKTDLPIRMPVAVRKLVIEALNVAADALLGYLDE